MKAPALVSTLWLRQRMLSDSKNLRILDGTWHLPNAGLDSKADHEKCRIPSSRHFDIDECCDKSSPFPHMLPSERQFAEYVQKLGISNDSHVVVYDTNRQCGLLSAPRVWWTFRVFGHNLVSVLDGGLPKWQEHDNPTISAPAEQDIPTGQQQPFKTEFQKHLVHTFESVRDNIDSPSRVQLGDARSYERFCGTGQEPRPELSAGHIPKSKSLPFLTLLDLDKKQMKPLDELHKVFQESGINVRQPLIGSCGSGVTGSMIALAAYICGNTNAAVYDGSWTEWAQRASEELIVKVSDNK